MRHTGKYQSHLETAKVIYWCVGKLLHVAAFPGHIFKTTRITCLDADGTIAFWRFYCKT